jgi:hypothetical protein
VVPRSAYASLVALAVEGISDLGIGQAAGGLAWLPARLSGCGQDGLTLGVLVLELRTLGPVLRLTFRVVGSAELQNNQFLVLFGKDTEPSQSLTGFALGCSGPC